MRYFVNGYYGKLHLGYGAVPWGQKDLDLQDKHDLVKLTLINAERKSFMLEQQLIA